jgi:kinesin family protein 4/21/27
MADCLDMGSHARRTAQTKMNEQSSRSHGIFTITIEQSSIHLEGADIETEKDFTVAKFHFVDLAGSERAKKTEATGSVFKEGVNIN